MNESRLLLNVILPIYNAERTIADALNSLLDQTFKDFIIIAIDDGSTDRSVEIIQSYKDKRIRLIRNENNRGLVYTLNRGIELSESKYIARMDADDICLPTRFEKQILYMESHPETIICGSFAKTFFESANGSIKEGWLLKYETSDRKVKEQLIYECCFAHPTVVIRRSALIEGSYRYEDNLKNGDDYKLWIDMMNAGNYHNIPEVLLKYRISSAQMSSNTQETLNSSNICRWYYLKKILDKKVFDGIVKNGINRTAVKYIKANRCANKYILMTFYLSFSTYTIPDLIYYVFSLDAFRLPIRTSLSFFKRFVKGPLPLIFDSNVQLK